MSRNKRFQWGKSYLITDIKEGVFVDEPAVYVGKHRYEKERPTICAVCGQPLGNEGYSSFHLMGPNSFSRDMLIGNGCIKARISEKELDIQGANPRQTLNLVVTEFPTGGRWYGTFLHHNIAKPYVRDRKAADNWDEFTLNLPGVRYIMKIIDDLRNEGWNLDAEKVLDCGNIDLLATHPEKGTIVFDWKSDKAFDNHQAYIDQINGYMSELYRKGMQKISGYIVWVMKRELEPIIFKGVSNSSEVNRVLSSNITLPIRCTLNIDMKGGQGIDKEKMTKDSTHMKFGDQVSFYIPPCNPWKFGHNFKYFEASPYREGERAQPFTRSDAEDGFFVSFICSKKRRSFDLVAYWDIIRPFDCTLSVIPKDNDLKSYFMLHSPSQIDAEGNDYVNFEVSEINRRLKNKVIVHATLLIDPSLGIKTEWNSDELQDGLKIKIPCIDLHSYFKIRIETGKKKMVVEEAPVKKHNHKPQPVANLFDQDISECQLPQSYHVSSASSLDNTAQFVNKYRSMSAPSAHGIEQNSDPAEHRFTPGRIYKSGERYYGIYKRVESDRHNTAGKVSVAEVDFHGKRISHLEWRYVYLTPKKKEFVYSPTDREWKIYTNNVLMGLKPKEVG